MKYKGLLLDIDNTLYPYQAAHRPALASVALACEQKYGFSHAEFEDAFKRARHHIHHQLAETASSHNRLLYFQTMLELLNRNALDGALEMYEQYWGTFLQHIKPFEGVYDLLQLYRDRICYVTDLTAHIQFRKVAQMNLNTYTSHMVTSEEAGIEKPDSRMFGMALKKLGLQPHEVCMIGDSFKKDIEGAIAMGMDAIWFNHEGKEDNVGKEGYTEVKDFKSILQLI